LYLRQIFLLIFTLVSHLILAQENIAKYTYSTGAEIFAGFIVKHHDAIGSLITGHPTGFRINFNRNSYGDKAWEQRYGYPTLSTSLSYYDLKNDKELGKIIALNVGLGFHLNDFNTSKNDFQAYAGFGLAYFSNPYNPETNNKNTLISSYLPWNVNLRLSYYRQVFTRLQIGVAVQLSHFSNAGSKIPNFGLNLANVNIGAKYKLSSQLPEYKTDKLKGHSFNKKSFINFDFRMGQSELKPVGSGPSPYFAFSVFWNKRIGVKSILDAGLEGFINKARQEEIKNNKILIEGNPDYRSVGVMFGHELILEKLALVTQVGVYVYKPYIPEERVYTKLGLKYYFTENVFSSLILKTHYAVAEVLEFGIGVRL
jgi:Lipid A 3-O-deacylase (PagL)